MASTPVESTVPQVSDASEPADLRNVPADPGVNSSNTPPAPLWTIVPEVPPDALDSEVRLIEFDAMLAPVTASVASLSAVIALFWTIAVVTVSLVMVALSTKLFSLAAVTVSPSVNVCPLEIPIRASLRVS